MPSRDGSQLGIGPTNGAFRLLVCGGAGFTDRARVFLALDAAHARRRIERLLQGSATEAVQLAAEWAAEHRCVREDCGPYWPGARRTPRTVDQAEVHAVLAFPGDDGSGWAQRALDAGLPVWRPYG